MPTMGWRDAAFTEASGPVRFRNVTVQIGPQHLARWKDDPDGRFGVTPSAVDPTKAELGKFYPSL
jgi:hypothetical protein